MGLSYLSNNQCFDSIDSDFTLQQSLELPQELDQLLCFQDDITLADTSIDPLFQPTFTPQPPLQTNQYHTSIPDSKRLKPTQCSNYEPMLPCSDPFFDTCFFNVSSSSADSPQLTLPFDETWVADLTFPPPVFSSGASDGGWNNGNSNISRRVGGLSAQSIAARQRRRKIAEKTQELGKLIPGGHKMNTAEMFQSASMYVKFLQAQIAVLTLTNSLQDGDKCYGGEQCLRALASSPAVREKLYSQEKCLAPRKLVKALSQDSKLQAEHPSVFQQINSVLMTQARQ